MDRDLVQPSPATDAMQRAKDHVQFAADMEPGTQALPYLGDSRGLPTRLSGSHKGERVNASVRAAAIQQMQRAYGNRATRRFLQRQAAMRTATSRPVVHTEPAQATATELTDPAPMQREAYTVGAPPVVQRVIAANVAEQKLRTILDQHGLGGEYGGLRDTARALAEQPDVTEENIGDKIKEHRDIMPKLLAVRLTSDEKPAKAGQLQGADKEIYDTLFDWLFYHVTPTTNVAAVKESGLDPNKGGTDGGISDVSSVTAQDRERNVSRSKKYSFVTRRESEAKQYKGSLEQKRVPATIMHVFISPEYRNTIELDKDSQQGLKDKHAMTEVGTGHGGDLNEVALKVFKRAMRNKYSEDQINTVYKQQF